MKHEKWEIYLAVARKIESGGRGNDITRNPKDLDMQREFVEIFKKFLPPVHAEHRRRVLAPGAVSEALFLLDAGYEVHALVFGSDNKSWLEQQALSLACPERLIVREHDAHDLDYPPGYFDGYFSVQFHEHLLAPLVHVGEFRYCCRDNAVAFIDACGTTNPAQRTIWHTNLVPEAQVLAQWEYWGFEELWRGPEGDNRPQFVLRARSWDDSAFENVSYLRWTMRLRAGEKVAYKYRCPHCKTTKDHEAVVDALYREIFGRCADSDGLRYYSEQIAAGSLSAIQLRAILNDSDEAKQRKMKSAERRTP